MKNLIFDVPIIEKEGHMINSLTAYNKLKGLPMGKYLFSRALCLIAPYFGSIKPRFVELKPGYCEVTIKNRRAVRNHLKSVHAIAMCNLCELTGGTALDATMPAHLRWIPRGMQIQYIKLAKTDLKGTCSISADEIKGKGSLPVTVSITDTGGTEVVRAVIDMYISERSK
jgi:acyl-coenzyme A thioesterase PaaI-like protein